MHCKADLGFAPKWRRRLTTWQWPMEEAECRGDQPDQDCSLASQGAWVSVVTNSNNGPNAK